MHFLPLLCIREVQKHSKQLDHSYEAESSRKGDNTVKTECSLPNSCFVLPAKPRWGFGNDNK